MNVRPIAHQLNALESRGVGALLGLAIGDAVGTTLEFQLRDSAPPLCDMIGGGPFGLASGTWTDDTSMALALADTLAGKERLDPRELMDRFVNWWRWGVYSPTGEWFDIRLTTRTAPAQFERCGKPIAG